MSFWREARVYVGRVREFGPRDWIAYASWVGLIAGLAAITTLVLVTGRRIGAPIPSEAWLVPIGAWLFTASVAIDTIGHRTVYRTAIAGGERLVHAITIATGIGSCVLLCAAYERPAAFWIPALVLTVLSFVYSLADEAFHWRRYVQANADRVEMWSHVGILSGHASMMLGWWVWFLGGYGGVSDVLAVLPGS
jgi:hypothetical protein